MRILPHKQMASALRVVVLYGGDPNPLIKLIGHEDMVFASNSSWKLERELAMGKVCLAKVKSPDQLRFVAPLPGKHQVQAWLVVLPNTLEPDPLLVGGEFARVVQVKSAHEFASVANEIVGAALSTPVVVKPNPVQFRAHMPSKAASLSKPQVRQILEEQAGSKLHSFALYRNLLTVAFDSNKFPPLEIAGVRLDLVEANKWNLREENNEDPVLVGQYTGPLSVGQVHQAVSRFGNARRVRVWTKAVEFACETQQVAEQVLKNGLQVPGAEITELQLRLAGNNVKPPRPIHRTKLQLALESGQVFDQDMIKDRLMNIDPTITVQYLHNARHAYVWFATQDLANEAIKSNILPGLGPVQSALPRTRTPLAALPRAKTYSIMIRNLPVDVSSAHLRPVFLQFDPNVALRISHQVATVSFFSEEARDKVLGQNMLVNGIMLEVSAVPERKEPNVRRSRQPLDAAVATTAAAAAATTTTMMDDKSVPKPPGRRRRRSRKSSPRPEGSIDNYFPRTDPPADNRGVIIRGVAETDRDELLQVIKPFGEVIKADFTFRSCKVELATTEQAIKFLASPPLFRDKKLSLKLWT
ncbi:hypothetical protein BASA81_008019 [Batrachochytrium salamandrivorans]|nr:hypothetical protein BASA81_008019 [Batrachochytrium salamandrivorans]